MVMEIEWTDTAKKNVRKLYKFYTKTASEEVAKKIIEPLFSFVLTLKESNSIGQIEEDLQHLKSGHRYLVLGHNKILYKIKNDKIFITHVFDTRQDPVKLK